MGAKPLVGTSVQDNQKCTGQQRYVTKVQCHKVSKRVGPAGRGEKGGGVVGARKIAGRKNSGDFGDSGRQT